MPINPDNFLTEEEQKLGHEFIQLQEDAFAWTELEKGKFSEEWFDPIVIPAIEHIPWAIRNLPIPPGLCKPIIKIIKDKIASGIYKPSNSSYRSQWFTVLKKDGKSLQIVHSLEPLNKVIIQHSGVPPIPEHLTEQFADYACGATLDLYVRYDE